MFFFRPKKIIFKGRSGLIFKPNKNESYYIDSEILNGKYDIVIYIDSIRKQPKNMELSLDKKNEISQLLLQELKNQGLKFIVR